MSEKRTAKQLLAENAELRQQLEDSQETLRAITSGEVDALIVNTKVGERAFTLQGADTVYRTAIENINEGAITLSLEGTILYSNKYFAQMMSTDLNKVIGASLFDFVAEENRERLARLLEQENGRDEMALQSATGTAISIFIAFKKLQLDVPTICAVITDLTEQKKSEALKESEEQFRTLSETSPVGVGVSSVDGILLYTNRSYELILGYDHTELIGKKAIDLYWDPEVRRSWMGTMKDTGIVRDVETRLKRKDGMPVWVSINASPISYKGKPAVMGTIQDITERKKAEESLIASETRYRRLFESAKDGILILDFDTGKVVDVNPFLLNLLDYSSQDILGRQLWEIGLFKDIVSSREAFTVLQNKGYIRYEDLPLETRNKQRIDVEFVSNVYEVDHTKVIQCNIRDITQRKKTEEELRRYSSEIELANKEMETFSYSVSHDLRAPLRGIDGFSNALLEDYSSKLDEKGKEYLNRIRESSQHMSQLIDGMLKLSRISRKEMHPDRVNLSSIVRSISEELKRSLPDRKAEFIIPQEIIAYGDKSLLDALLSNLLENAWKFTSKCNQTRIEFGNLHQNGEVVYFIKDNGAGFDMHYSDKLFQPFSRLHNQKDFPGTGIGLANVQRIVRRHGGRVWAEGELNKGATFYFTLSDGAK